MLSNENGRAEIYTDEKEITNENIISVLQKAIIVHQGNVNDYNFLLDYDAGVQPLLREKEVRPEIDVSCVDNVANEITEFNLGYKWGYPITLVQRGNSDSGKESSSDNSDNKEKKSDSKTDKKKNAADETKAITLLNECYSATGCVSDDQKLARFIEICGVGYTYIDINTDYTEGDSYFIREALDPRFTFVVRSTRYLDHRIVLGVTYSEDTNHNQHFTCFTKDRRFEIVNLTTKQKWYEDGRNDEKNPLGIIPIIEWIRSYDRMGAWERQIPEMDNLNLIISDFSNDIDQTTQAIWHANDVQFPVKRTTDSEGNEVLEIQSPVSGDWAITQTTADGKTPFIKALTIPYDYSGMLNNIVTRRALILQKCNVPQRNDNSGGSTGIAMSDATGWSAADAAANKQQLITERCKINEVKVALAAIKASPNIERSSELLKLKYSDVKPNIKRQRTYELTTKLNAFATGVSHGLDWKSLVREINMFNDPEQVIADSKKTMKMYIDSTLKPKEENKDNNNGANGNQQNALNQLLQNGNNTVNGRDTEKRNDQDYSDQQGNSPMLGKGNNNPPGNNRSNNSNSGNGNDNKDS